MQNCFLDPTLKAKLCAVRMPTLASFNEIIESHKAGKKAANTSASANAIKGKAKHVSSKIRRNKIKFPTQRDRCRKILGKCFRFGKPYHFMPACKFRTTVKCNSCHYTIYLSAAGAKLQNARSAQL